jgi:hypothetical protein
MRDNPRQIEVGEWLYKGCFIQEFKHPKLLGKYSVIKNNKEQDHVGRASTMKEAKRMCRDNECHDNYMDFEWKMSSN